MKATTRAEVRAANLEKIMDGYDVEDQPDSSVPGSARIERTAQRYPCDVEAGRMVNHPRYALVTQYGDKGNYRVHLANDRPGVERLAAYLATDVDGAEQSVCFYDLDELAGEEEQPLEVTYDGETWRVHGPEFLAGDRTGAWVLKKSPKDRRSSSYDWAVALPSACDVGDWEDERMPVRYGVAKVMVSVVFNTVPSPP